MTDSAGAPTDSPSSAASSTQSPRSSRIAAIDWMRGLVMILMVIDHVSMAFNGGHNSKDTVALADPTTVFEPFAFLTRWATHLCAPTFVFLAGTALALSIERKLEKGADAKSIDWGLLTRGAFIALLDPTLVSLFSGRWTIQVLYVIGVSMMCMAVLRRLSTKWLLAVVGFWFIAGDAITMSIWDPTDHTPSIWSSLLFVQYSDPGVMVIKYPLIPWLMMMLLGWLFGRYLLNYNNGKARLDPMKLLMWGGLAFIAAFAVIRWLNGYGNAGLLRPNDTWEWFLRVSKYPPSLTFTLLELGVFAIALSLMMVWERRFGSRPNGVLLVFGQTAMFFYLVHRIVLEGPATYLGLRGFGDLGTTYLISALLLLVLYPVCLWYRGLKQRHRGAAWTTYL